MSDQFILCPKCGEELKFMTKAFDGYYYCKNCDSVWRSDEVRIVTTEYLKGEENAQGNQSSRSKE